MELMNSAHRFMVSAAAATERCVQNVPQALNRGGRIYSLACRGLGCLCLWRKWQERALREWPWRMRRILCEDQTIYFETLQGWSCSPR